VGNRLNRIAGGACPSNNGGGEGKVVSGVRSLSKPLIFVDVCKLLRGYLFASD